MNKKIQVHIPYPILLERFKDVLTDGLNPEIFFDGKTLDGLKEKDLRDIKKGLDERGIRITIHGPFMELSPGSPDELIRLTTIERYRQIFYAAGILKPAVVVLHAGYDERRFDGDVGLWLKESVKTWKEFVGKAEELSMAIALENVFEENPLPIKMLMETIVSPNFGVCMDAGHLNLYSKVKMDEWFIHLGGRIKEVHIHDNHGKLDEHLAVGDGLIDFTLFFSLLKKHCKEPVYTIEPHTEDALKKGLQRVGKFIEG